LPFASCTRVVPDAADAVGATADWQL